MVKYLVAVLLGSIVGAVRLTAYVLVSLASIRYLGWF